MARTFYTERDIEDLAKRGVTEIPVDDSVYITDSAIDLMDKLGIKRKFKGAPPPRELKKQTDVKPQNPTEEMAAGQRDTRTTRLKARARALLITEIQGLERLFARCKLRRHFCGRRLAKFRRAIA